MPTRPWPTINAIVPFGFWTEFTPVVPDVYKNAISPQQEIHDMACLLHKMKQYLEMMAHEVNVDKEALNALIAEFEKFMDGGFEDYYEAELRDYIIENFPALAQVFLTNGVFFGLNDEGYFVAYVANQMEFVLDTISDSTSENYGHLTITY